MGYSDYDNSGYSSLYDSPQGSSPEGAQDPYASYKGPYSQGGQESGYGDQWAESSYKSADNGNGTDNDPYVAQNIYNDPRTYNPENPYRDLNAQGYDPYRDASLYDMNGDGMSDGALTDDGFGLSYSRGVNPNNDSSFIGYDPYTDPTSDMWGDYYGTRRAAKEQMARDAMGLDDSRVAQNTGAEKSLLQLMIEKIKDRKNKKDDEEDEEKKQTLREKVRAVFKTKGFLGVMFMKPFATVIFIFLIVHYLFLVATQGLLGLSSVTGIGQAAGAAAGFEQNTTGFGMTLNPFELLMSASVRPGYFLFSIFFAGITTAAIMIYAWRKYSSEEDDRKFNIAENNTYGSAQEMKEEDVRENFKITKPDETEGIILGLRENPETHKKEALCLPKDTGFNRHVAIYGCSGSGKSFSYSRPNILERIKEGESFIATDPSGELYRDTAKLAREKGMVVKALNIKDFYASDAWDCLKEIRRGDNVDLLAETFASVVIQNTSINAKTDAFWDSTELNLLKALILYVGNSESYEGERTIGEVYNMIAKAAEALKAEEMAASGGRGKQGSIGDIDSNLEVLDFEMRMSALPPDDPAYQPFLFYQAAGNIKKNIVLGLATRLGVFQNKLVKEALGHDEIDLSLPGKVPCAYYVISSTQESTFNFLSTLFFSFVFIDLVREAESQLSLKLPVPVYLILDEFPSIGTIVDFQKKIANVRKYQIFISLIFQNLAQLESKYPDNVWISILSNCDVQLILGVNDNYTAKFVSELSGDATILNESSSKSSQVMNNITGVRAPGSRTSESTSDGKRMLYTPHEVRTLKNREELIMLRGYDFLKAKKYGYPNHEYAPIIDRDDHKELPQRHVPLWQKGQSEKREEKRNAENTKTDFYKKQQEDKISGFDEDAPALSESEDNNVAVEYEGKNEKNIARPKKKHVKFTSTSSKLEDELSKDVFEEAQEKENSEKNLENKNIEQKVKSKSKSDNKRNDKIQKQILSDFADSKRPEKENQGDDEPEATRVLSRKNLEIENDNEDGLW